MKKVKLILLIFTIVGSLHLVKKTATSESNVAVGAAVYYAIEASNEGGTATDALIAGGYAAGGVVSAFASDAMFAAALPIGGWIFAGIAV